MYLKVFGYTLTLILFPVLLLGQSLQVIRYQKVGLDTIYSQRNTHINIIDTAIFSQKINVPGLIVPLGSSYDTTRHFYNDKNNIPSITNTWSLGNWNYSFDSLFARYLKGTTVYVSGTGTFGTLVSTNTTISTTEHSIFEMISKRTGDALHVGDEIGALKWSGWDSTSYITHGSYIQVLASEGWTSTNHGTDMRFSTTLPGAADASLRAYFDVNGFLQMQQGIQSGNFYANQTNVGINTTSPTTGLLQIDGYDYNNNLLTLQVSNQTPRTYGLGLYNTSSGAGFAIRDNTTGIRRLAISDTGDVLASSHIQMVDGDISQPFTTIEPDTSTYLRFSAISTVNGGGAILGVSTDNATNGLTLRGYVGSTSPLTTASGINLRSGKLSGTTGTDMGATEEAITLNGFTTTTRYLTILGSGNMALGQPTSVAARFTVKNGLFSHIVDWINSRDVTLSYLDSVGKFVATHLDVSKAGTPTVTITRTDNTTASGTLVFRGSDGTADWTVATNSAVGTGLEFTEGSTNRMYLLTGGNLALGQTTATTGRFVIKNGTGSTATNIFELDNSRAIRIYKIDSTGIPYADTLKSLAGGGIYLKPGNKTVTAVDTLRAKFLSAEKIVLDSMAYGSAYIEEAADDSITISSSSQYYTVGAKQGANGYPLTSGGILKNMTVQDSSMTIGVNGVHHVFFSGGGRSINIAAESEIHGHLFVNDVLVLRAGADAQSSATGTKGRWVWSSTLTLNDLKKGDILKVKLNSPDDAAGTVIVRHFNLEAHRME